MRSILSLVVVISLILLTGCANEDSAPAPEPEAPADAQQISNEDFESGEVEGVTEDEDASGEESPEGEDSGDSP
jgi:hypothetical protein